MPVDYPKLPLLHINQHTDWFTDELFNHPYAQQLIFNYSRFYADMERLANDPLEESGMGIFYTITPWNIEYRDKEDDQFNKVMEIYQQWHKQLKDESHHHNLIIDCHSFSYHQVNYDDKRLPDFNIGTNVQTTSDKVTKLVKDFLTERGYSVEVNFPYAYSIEPHSEIETIMIEVNKRIYLTDDLKKNDLFNKVKIDLAELLENLYQYESSLLK
jgi:N-formylglutamate amidohydrolase